jgi:hypothetical protein
MPPREPKASYLVHRLGRRYLLELFDDELVVSGSVIFGPSFKIGYRLSEIDPRPYEMTTRDERISALLAGVVVFGVVPVMMAIWRLRGLPFVGLFLLWLLGGATFAILHPFRIHHLNYRLRSGIAIASVSKAGRDKDKRDEFAAALDAALAQASNVGS